ncbi:hypothetical protein [Sphingopyxis terrae]|jgi:hypothetical protein|nr:hypothetical protein [Sphingopyxis terrae]|tara:strand:+ start:154 stop:285 length:132 start_codon:yes stop_codon:yes gene_type:complete
MALSFALIRPFDAAADKSALMCCVIMAPLVSQELLEVINLPLF